MNQLATGSLNGSTGMRLICYKSNFGLATLLACLQGLFRLIGAEEGRGCDGRSSGLALGRL